MPRRLRESPSFTNRISPSCWGEEIRNSSSASAKISASSAVELLAHAARDLRQALQVQAHAEQLHLAQDRDQGQLDVVHHLPQAAVCDLLALPGRQRAEHDRVAGERILGVACQAALFAQLGEGIAAPCRLQQVGAQQRVVAQPGRHQAERLGVVGDDGPLPAGGHDLLGALAISGQHLDGPARWAVGVCARPDGDGEAPGRSVGEQGALGRLAGARNHPQLGVLGAQAGDIRRGAGAHARAEGHLGDRRRRGDLGIAQRLLEAAQRIAQLVGAEDLAHARAVGLAGRLGRDIELYGDVALDRRQAALRRARPRRARSGSVCAWGR